MAVEDIFEIDLGKRTRHPTLLPFGCEIFENDTGVIDRGRVIRRGEGFLERREVAETKALAELLNEKGIGGGEPEIVYELLYRNVIIRSYDTIGERRRCRDRLERRKRRCDEVTVCRRANMRGENGRRRKSKDVVRGENAGSGQGGDSTVRR